MKRCVVRWCGAVVSACAAVLLTSCSVTRNLPPDAYMLTRNVIETDKEAPRGERISAGDLDRYVRQSPPKKFLGTNLPVWIYNQADTAKDNGWNNMLRKIGSEPVILDTLQTAASTRDLKLYMNSRGFYESEAEYSIKYKEKKRKAVVTYSVKQREPYRIRSISYDYQDKFLEQVIRSDSASTLLHAGAIFDLTVLDEERKRIASFLKDRGYYAFTIGNINYVADTTAGERTVDLTMVVKQHVEGYDDKGEPILANNSVYRLSNIYVYPDYDATLAATDPDYLRSMDTTYYRGLNIVGLGKPRITPQTLRRAIPLYPGYLYSSEDQQRTSSNLLRLNYFKNANVSFSVPSADEDTYITYVGGDDSADGDMFDTSEKALDCNIFCTPGLRQGYTLDFEATTSSAFYALRPTVSYLNRNLFRGAELLNISLTGGYEFNRDDSDTKNSYEVGVSASISFPRFFAPFKIDRAGKLFRPTTKIELSTNLQRKSKYHRNITGASIGYTWSNGRHSSYTVRPIDINIVDVSFIDKAFLCSIQNHYLRESYRSQYIAAISGSYVYNNIFDNGNTLTFRANVETAGNLTDALAHWISKPVTEIVNSDDCTDSENTPERYETFYKLFNIRYSQYVRMDASISGTVRTGFKTSFAYRLFGGIGVPYGNSSTLPMDRMFYVGGSNSMRGWNIRTLGPGSSSEGLEPGFKKQLGNMRLEANAEFRFPIWNSLYGALFFDVGNVWMVGIPGESEDEVFRFDSFYKQLGLNTGFGLRYDLSLIVIRLDWGVQLHNPAMPVGQRWIRNFRWGNTALNFGIGYPF